MSTTIKVRRSVSGEIIAMMPITTQQILATSGDKRFQGAVQMEERLSEGQDQVQITANQKGGESSLMSCDTSAVLCSKGSVSGCADQHSGQV